MPRRKVQFVRGGYYHIYNRGAGRQSICVTDGDFLCLVRLLKEVSHACEVTVIAYCHMPNHFHWLVRQDGDVAARLLPQRVFGSYTRTFNHTHHRSGTLFEARFHARLVEGDAYLRNLCRYVHANPVRHGIASAPELWPYSNYLEWLELRPGTLVDPAFVATYFTDKIRYRQYVTDYVAGRDRLPPTLERNLRDIELVP